MRVDEKTKEVIQEWSLTNIKRWAASPKSFTLDFGDYQDGYYSVQTTEGEQIAQLIAGYIDIILKKVSTSAQPEPSRALCSLSQSSRNRTQVLGNGRLPLA